MERIAIFPGSFDPITRGHENVVIRALPLFDKIIVAVGENAEKRTMFSLEERVLLIKNTFSDMTKVEVESYTGLTVDFCKSKNATFILRGLRTAADFEFERSIGQVNKMIYNTIETLFILTLPEYTALNSSIVRDIIKNGGDARQFVPEAVRKFLETKHTK